MNRKLLAFFVVGLMLIIARIAVGCHALTPAEQAQVAKDDVKLGACFATSHLCKVAAKALNPDAGSFPECWAEFDACMVAHGYMDGGK